MIVRLTRTQVSRAARLIDDESLLGWLVREHPGEGLRFDVSMPAIGWKRIADTLFDHCYDERGFRARKVRNADFNALRAIRRALNARETHPALFDMAAVGAVTELIPAWKYMTKGPAAYSPYPMLFAPFVVLAPVPGLRGTMKVTSWVEAKRPPEYPLLSEPEHWRLTP